MEKHPVRLAITLAGVAALSALSALLSSAAFVSHGHMPTTPTPTVPADLAVPATVPATLLAQAGAMRLRIPAIRVDAAIEAVGLTADGAVGTPKGRFDVAWFDMSPRPGETGSSVIDGHYGWKDNLPAVFDDLSKLHPGDKLYVDDGSGSSTVFVVRKVVSYGENDAAASVFGTNDGKAHLNLITCEGIWNKARQSYSGRLVVFADGK